MENDTDVRLLRNGHGPVSLHRVWGGHDAWTVRGVQPDVRDWECGLGL